VSVASTRRTVVPRFRADRGKWEVDYRDHHGKRHRPLFSTEEQALGYAADVAKTLSQTPVVEDADVTLAGYVARWLEAATHEMEKKTTASYRQLLEMHVLPTLGSIKLRDLHRRQVKALLTAKRAERLPRKKKADNAQTAGGHAAPPKVGYSRNTVRLIKAALSTVLSDAVDDGYMAMNPAFSAGRKRGRRAETITQAERMQKIRPLSWEQRDAFLAASASDRRHSALFAMYVKAGLRPGEGMGLKPEDFDFNALTVQVERAVSDGGHVKDCKTHEARTVDLTPDLGTMLKRHVTWLRAEALRTGSGEPQWMFPREDGSLMDKDYLTGVFRRTLKRADLPHHRPYDLRHTYASLLLAQSAPITYVSQQLGHSSPATTLRYYAKWVPTKGIRWVNALDRKVSASAAVTPYDSGMEPETGTTMVRA
jgi:integrase